MIHPPGPTIRASLSSIATAMRLPAPLRVLVLASLLAIAAPAGAQGAAAGFDPRTGDAWVDTWLGDVNRYGTTYRDPFVDELVRYHRAPRDLVVDLLRRPGWTPGDVYFACSLAAVIGRPCRYVVDEYERDRGAGWGALAQRLGIKPGSAEFHRLKRGFVPTYDRWGRPIQLDSDLEPAFPGRPKSAKPSRPAADGTREAEAPGAAPRESEPGGRDTGPAPKRDAGYARLGGKGPRASDDGTHGATERAAGKGPKDATNDKGRKGPSGKGRSAGKGGKD
jgi:hypothetical protein